MPSKTPAIAITGANGFLGSALVTHFSQKGWQVIGLVRTPHSSNDKNVSYKTYDITQNTLDTALLTGVDYLVHTAYVKYDRQHPDAMDINLNGARTLLAASRQAGIKKNIFISSMSSHEEAVSVYGRQKLAVEALFNDSSGIILRCGLILGNGGIVKQMADFMKSKHMVPLIGGGTQPLQVVSVADLVVVVEKAATSKLHGIFTIATPEVYSYREFYKALARALDSRVLFVPVPFTLLLYGFKTAALLRLPLGVGEDNLMGLKALRAAPTADDLAKLNVRLTGLEQALTEILPKHS